MFPFWLSSLRLSLNNPGISFGLKNDGLKQWAFCIFIDQLLWIFHPLFLSLQEAYIITQNQMMLESKQIDNEKYSQNIEKQKELGLYLKMFKKLESNLETIFQMTGRIILLALVGSNTRTTQSLSTIFDNKDIFGIPARLFIFLSIALSFARFTFSQITGIAGCRIYFPIRSKILIGSSALLSSVVRVTTFILYFSPCLGLWNSLRHFQG